MHLQENCSCVWPLSPFSIYPAVKDEDLEYPDPLNSIPAACSPTPSAHSETNSLFSESPEPIPMTAKSLTTQAESPSLKHACVTTPDHTTREVPNHLLPICAPSVTFSVTSSVILYLYHCDFPVQVSIQILCLVFLK